MFEPDNRALAGIPHSSKLDPLKWVVILFVLNSLPYHLHFVTYNFILVITFFKH